MVGTKVKVWPFLAGGTCWGVRCNQFVPSQTQVSFRADPPKSVIPFRASSYANACPKRLAGAVAGIRTFQLVPVHAQVAERFAPDLLHGSGTASTYRRAQCRVSINISVRKRAAKK